MGKFKFEALIGIGLLVVAILGFVLSIILNLPKSDQVRSRAQTLTEVPADLFSSENPLNQAIRTLIVPANIPVSPDPANTGRSNVFENF